MVGFGKLGKYDIGLVIGSFTILFPKNVKENIKKLRIIDDEDVAEKCHSWIRNQNFKVTPAAFKKFIENELFPSIGIAKEKSITLMTATRCK